MIRVLTVLWLVGCGGWRAQAPPPPPVVVEELADGAELAASLEDVRVRAAATGRRAFVQVTADWCAPCRELRASMPDPRMQAAMRGVLLLQVDHDGYKVALAGLLPPTVEVVSVPAFFEIDPGGGLGRMITGHAWGPNTPEEMAPVLEGFFQAAPADGAASAP